MKRVNHSFQVNKSREELLDLPNCLQVKAETHNPITPDRRPAHCHGNLGSLP